METCKSVLEMAKSDPLFLDSVVSVDEVWYFEYSPQTKRQSTEWCSLLFQPTKNSVPKTKNQLKRNQSQGICYKWKKCE